MIKLQKFTVSSNLNFVLAFSHKIVNFFTLHGVLIKDDKNYTISTPYAKDEIENLRFTQNGDVLYIFHPNHPIMTLKRYGNTDWRLEELILKDGPWENVNTDEDIKMSVSANDGHIRIYATNNIFKANDKGRLIRLTSVDDGGIKAWQAGQDVSIGQIVYSDHKYYMYVRGTGSKTGTLKPEHTSGTKSDGGVDWKYLHAGYGVARITKYISQKEVEADVISQFPSSLVGTANTTDYWELGLIYSGNEYPMCGTFFRNRFCFMLNNKGIPYVCMSCSEDYDNFADKDFGEILAENAFTVPVMSAQYNEGCWLCAADVLFVGTSSGEFYIDSASAAEAISAENSKIQQISTIGSKAIEPIKVGAHILFVTASGTSVRDIVYSYATDAYDPVDIALFGKHLLSSGICDMVYQEYPDKVVWFAGNDGRLIGMTFSSEQNVVALHQHNISGDVKNLAVIPNLENGLEDLWLIVSRQIADKEIHTIEWLDNGIVTKYPKSINQISDMDLKEEEEALFMKNNAFYVDAGVSTIRGHKEDYEGKLVLEAVNMQMDEVSVWRAIMSKKQIIAENAKKAEISFNKLYMTRLSIEFTNHVGGGYYTLTFPDNLVGAKVHIQQYDGMDRIRGNDVYTIGNNSKIVRIHCYYSNATVEADKLHTKKTRIFIDNMGIKKEKISLNGLDYLEGKEVAIMVDGAERERQIVCNGSITVWNTDFNIVVGLPIESAYIPQTIYIQGDSGSGVGDVQRINRVYLMLWRSLGGKIGKSFTLLQDINFRKSNAVMNESAPLYTGNKEIAVDFDTTTIKEKGATILIYNDSVYPMNILAIAPHFSTSGNGL